MKKTYLIVTQFYEDYEVRFKPKGGSWFIVETVDFGTAISLVQKYLVRKEIEWIKKGEKTGLNHAISIEFPIIPADQNTNTFDNFQQALDAIPEWDRNSHIHLVQLDKKLDYKDYQYYTYKD